MKKIHVIITTYNRPGMLKNLLNDIFEYARGYDLSIDITDDGSSENYELTDIFIQCESEKKSKIFSYIKYYKNNKNQGKEGYWITVNSIFDRTRQINADYYFMLPDDVRLKNDFFKKDIGIYDAINDAKKICLNLLLDKSREGKICWTGITPHKKKFGNIEVYITGWNDLCFITKKDFFKALDFKIRPISSERWNENTMLSSGVGRQISIRLYNFGYRFYQVTETLIEHGTHISKMNPAARKKIPIITTIGNNKITASMATIPSRVKYLQ